MIQRVFHETKKLQVDRSVTGLIAQQQCVGPLQTPVADVAVVAFSYWHNVIQRRVSISLE